MYQKTEQSIADERLPAIKPRPLNARTVRLCWPSWASTRWMAPMAPPIPPMTNGFTTSFLPRHLSMVQTPPVYAPRARPSDIAEAALARKTVRAAPTMLSVPPVIDPIALALAKMPPMAAPKVPPSMSASIDFPMHESSRRVFGAAAAPSGDVGTDGVGGDGGDGVASADDIERDAVGGPSVPE